jgi:hypothetical protein
MKDKSKKMKDKSGEAKDKFDGFMVGLVLERLKVGNESNGFT